MEMMTLRQLAAKYSGKGRGRAVAMVGGADRMRHFSSFFSSPESTSPPPPPPPPVNPPDAENPDAATLREQWRYAIGLYSKWYSHAWGTAILAGLSFFALGWYVKGDNPLLPKQTTTDPTPEETKEEG